MRRAALVAIALLALAPAMFRNLSAAEVPKQPDEERVRTEIKHILSAPEYNRKFRTDSNDPISEFIERNLERLLEWLQGAVSDGSASSMSKALAVAIMVLFVGLCVLLALKVTGGLRARLPNGDADLPDDFELPSSSRLMAEAAKLANAGDYRGAFLRAYLGSISYLDEVGALRFERSRTNWEYLRDLGSRGHDSLVHELRPLTSDFDRKLYGHDHCTQHDYDRAVEAYDQVRRTAA